MATKHCSICGDEFTTNRHYQKKCWPCYHDGPAIRIAPKTCVWCDGTFRTHDATAQRCEGCAQYAATST